MITNLSISLGLLQHIIITKTYNIILSSSSGGIFVMSFLLMGYSVISALIVTGTVTLIVVDILGMMGWLGMPLNAVSLVDLGIVS